VAVAVADAGVVRRAASDDVERAVEGLSATGFCFGNLPFPLFLMASTFSSRSSSIIYSTRGSGVMVWVRIRGAVKR
jgi:hypothetical protein